MWLGNPRWLSAEVTKDSKITKLTILKNFWLNLDKYYVRTIFTSYYFNKLTIRNPNWLLSGITKISENIKQNYHQMDFDKNFRCPQFE